MIDIEKLADKFFEFPDENNKQYVTFFSAKLFAEAYHKAMCEQSEREGWVSVDDRLPNKGEDVLVYAGWSITAIWDGENTFYTEDGTNPIYHVSHWQYLPAAPTDKE